MRVLLINPPTGNYRRSSRCQSTVDSQTIRPSLPPIDLMYTARHYQKQGHDCIIRDYPAENATLYALITDIVNFEPDMLVMAYNEPTKEADELLYEECRGYARNLKLSHDMHINLSDCPARDSINKNLYLAPDTGKPITIVKAGKGCKYDCIYCGKEPDYEMRPPLLTALEVADCVKSGITDFLIDAPNLTQEKQWINLFCGYVRDFCPGIRWACTSRVDTLDGRISDMAESGCYLIGIGIESIHDIRKQIGKNFTDEQCSSAVKLCREYNIKSYCFFMIGFPWDNNNTIRGTINLCKRLNPDFFDFNVLYPMKGTEMERICRINGLIIKNGTYSDSSVKTFYLSHEELTWWRKRALLECYLRPWYIIRTLLFNRKYIRKYIKEGFKKLWSLI